MPCADRICHFGRDQVKRLYFTTHADVVIDPNVPVPDWGLTDRGFARHQAFSERVTGVEAVWSSDEQKAKDGAGVVAGHFGLKPKILFNLHENDRSSTGYLAGEMFWTQVEAFFANPMENVRGWERAIDAQSRVVQAVTDIIQYETEAALAGDIVIVAHGGIGALLRAHLKDEAIKRTHDQPPGKGGCCMILDPMNLSLVQDWTLIEEI